MTATDIVDLTGKAIIEIRAFPAVAAITSLVTGELGANEGPPAVVIESLAIDYNPGGGTRRLGLQAPTFAAKCYGTGVHGRVQASQLANAVVAAVNIRGPRIDASGRVVHLSLVESGGNVELDPVTKWPYATVIFALVGGQQAVPIA